MHCEVEPGVGFELAIVDVVGVRQWRLAKRAERFVRLIVNFRELSAIFIISLTRRKLTMLWQKPLRELQPLPRYCG